MNLANRRLNGFTLLEVLIAIFITAAIGLGSWQVLNQAIRTNELTQARLAELGSLQKAMFFLARDMQQVTPRSIRDEFGDYQPAMSTKDDEVLVEFTRVGWRNPLNDQRSELQRVAYELNPDGELLRHTWLVLDRAQDSAPRSRTLMAGLSELRVSFLNETGEWVDEWPPVSNSSSAPADPMSPFNALPRAANVVLTSDRFGEMNRVFDFVAYKEQQDMPGIGSGAGGAGSGTGGTGNGASPVDDESVGGESEEQIR